jgi:O-antigen/teichoic acid export membrane protein
MREYMSKSYINDIYKYLPSQVFPTEVGFISTPVIARLFPPVDYGKYLLIMATTNWCAFNSYWMAIYVND